LSKANRKTITLLCVVAGCFSQIKDRCKAKSPVYKIAQTAYNYTVCTLEAWPLDVADTNPKIYKKSIEIVGLWEEFIQQSQWYKETGKLSLLCFLAIADAIANDLFDTYIKYNSTRRRKFNPIFKFIGKMQNILDLPGIKFEEYQKASNSVVILNNLIKAAGW